MIDMLIHDKRLIGSTPAMAQNIYGVDGTVPVQHILGWAGGVAHGTPGGLRRLIIMCHGFVSADSHRGGYGLQLGSEGITWETRHYFLQLRDAVKVIVLYACKPVDRDVARGQSGMMLFQQIAHYANCYVVGSDSDQVYSYGATTPIDFGKWEGRVFIIAPNGNHQVIDPDFSLVD
jgi:hypothetical protein